MREMLEDVLMGSVVFQTLWRLHPHVFEAGEAVIWMILHLGVNCTFA